MRDIVVFGAGGHGRETHQLLLDINADRATWNVLGFLDGDSGRLGSEVHALPVLGDTSWISGRSGVAVTVAIGATAAKRSVVQGLIDAGCERFATLVHPGAGVGRGVELGDGSMVCAACVVTSDVRIGQHVILNVGCTVSHDSVLGDYVTLAPGVNISGAAGVGEGCDLGVGSAVIQGVRIGEWSVVGAGAVVVRDLAPNVTAVGVPATPIKSRPEGWQLA
jgi:sugar O-acyltransferase (sialic acid O-acetyltransferase NeuD family)